MLRGGSPEAAGFFGGEADAGLCGGGAESAEGFVHGFVAEAKDAVVDGHDGACAGVLGHVEGLFWGGVGGEVGVVSGDADAGEVDTAGLAEGFPSIEVSGVGAEEDSVLGGFEEEAAVAAVGVGEDTCAPVFEGYGGDAEVAEGLGVGGGEFVDGGEAEVGEEVGAAGGSEDGGVAVMAGEAAQGGAVEVVEVGVGDEDGVEPWQVGEGEGGGDVSCGPGGEESESEADAGGEDGVGEEVEAGEAEEDGGVSDGECGGVGELGVGQGSCGVGQGSSGAGSVEEIEESEAAGASAEAIGDTEQGR